MSATAPLRPYYADEWVALYHGDCREILATLHNDVALVLTDPPYGVGWDTDGRSRGGRYFPPIVGASRIYLGAHWLSDVLGGFALGGLWPSLLVAVMLAGARPGGRDVGLVDAVERAA